MFHRNFKSFVSVAMSILTLSAFCQPIRAMNTESVPDGGRLMWGSNRYVTVNPLFKANFYKCQEFKSTSVSPINIQSMSYDDVARYLIEQIIKFESLGDGDTFVVDQDVRTRSNPRLLALIMKGFNEIFDRYPILVDYIMFAKSKYPQSVKKFRISFLSRSVLDYDQVVARYVYGRGVEFNRNLMRSPVFDVMSTAWRQVKSGFHSDLHPEMLVEAAVAHEMGHVIDSIIRDNNSKCKIIKLARSRNRNFNSQNAYKSSTEISKLGERNAQEWFAELFAHLMYGHEQNDLSEAMRSYLSQEFKKLRKSIREMS